jgi:hypothetical protein
MAARVRSGRITFILGESGRLLGNDPTIWRWLSIDTARGLGRLHLEQEMWVRIPLAEFISGWCNGSIPGSEPGDLGSNPSPEACFDDMGL